MEAQDNTREVVEDAARHDARIRYVSRGGAVGMRDNFENVLRQVKPGFVIALGGDDGLLPDGIVGMRGKYAGCRYGFACMAGSYIYISKRSWIKRTIMHLPSKGTKNS